MIYIVCGILRSGTSMMMAALEAGGLETAHTAEARKRLVNGRDPHPSGMYQPRQADIKALIAGAAGDDLDGKPIKVFHRQVARIAHQPTGIRVVFMRRDPAETEASAREVLGPPPGSLVAENAAFDKIIAAFIERPDVTSADVFNFREVVAEPGRHFALLAEHGWPIDADAAAAIPNEQHVHHTKETIDEQRASRLHQQRPDALRRPAR